MTTRTKRRKQDAGCPHPLSRQWSWFAYDDTRTRGPKFLRGAVVCVACCDCGAVLEGGVEGAAMPEEE